MSFCADCATYLVPDAASCPTCGTPRPPVEPIAALWSRELDEPPAGPLLVAADLLLAPTGQPDPTAQHSTLRALNLVDGSPRWQHTFEYRMVSGLSVTPNGLVLLALTSTDLLRGAGALLALDARGEERWRWAPGVQRVSAPAVAEEKICLTADTRTLVVIDATTGAEQTRIPLPASASWSAPAIVSGVARIC